jgi:hypothetical protein
MSLTMLGELLKSRVTHVLLMLLGVGLFAYFLYEDNRLSRITSKYRSTPCVIKSSKVLVHVTRNRRGITTRVNFKPEITYSYEVAGKTYTSSVYRHGEQGMEEDEVVKVVSGYGAGEHSRCWVDPDDPEQAVLSRDSDQRSLGYIAVLALIALLGGAAGWAFLEFVVHRPAQLTHAPEEHAQAW